MSYEIVDSKPGEECGVFGIYSTKDIEVSSLIYLGIHSLQHRGQESAGMAIVQGEKMNLHKDNGLVDNVVSEEIIDQLKGNKGIGHVRYSTTGSSQIINAQPLLINSAKGSVALAHNGNLINGKELRSFLEKNGSIFHSELDTEVIAHLIARSPASDIEGALADSLNQIKGAFSLVILTKDKLMGVRDPRGFRPLILGEFEDGYVLASETSALEIIEADHVRDIQPGEMIIIDDNGYNIERYQPKVEANFCVFEYIYLARPDSKFNGNNVQKVRQEMGRQLARETENQDDIDIVSPVPDSGISAAQGFAWEADKPFQFSLIRNKYVGRTFISPVQKIRNLKVKMKLNPVKEIVAGKKVALVDDSIVRGTTSRQLVSMLKEAGAKEVHIMISSPPVTNPCYYGLDISTRQELIASEKEVEDIRKEIGADSLTYLSLEGLSKIMEDRESGYCDACFSGDYPTVIGDDLQGEGCRREK